MTDEHTLSIGNAVVELMNDFVKAGSDLSEGFSPDEASLTFDLTEAAGVLVGGWEIIIRRPEECPTSSSAR